MPVEEGARVVYWDASALLSTLVADAHSDEARRQLEEPGHNLVSTLAHAEVLAVLGRMERGGLADGEALRDARAAFLEGPWRWVLLPPERELLEHLAYRHALRGADLWHLSMAATLRRSLGELQLLTYDAALAKAAAQHGGWPFVCPVPL